MSLSLEQFRADPRQSDLAVERVRRNQLALAFVPGLEDFGGRRTAENAGVDEPGELDVWDMSAGAVDAFKIPDCFGAGGETELVEARWAEWVGGSYAEG